MDLPVSFVEHKSPDFQNVAKLLASSARDNRWTNFGPVWAALKTHIESALALPADRCAVPCASGTHALLAAAALAERNGPLRWLCPDYAFRATAIGPFAGAQFIDCNQSGAFDAEILGRVDQTSYDGIVALNPFGLLNSMDSVVDFARRLGKALIIDNALGLFGPDRRDHRGVFECISLHHTKPFGFGEGGCLIVDRELEGDAVQALDFGYGWRWQGGERSLSNGKLSEPAAAFILDRLQHATTCGPDYRRQFLRILKIAEGSGLRILLSGDLGAATPGNLPLLCPRPISKSEAENDLVTTAKYYRPITGKPVATDIYDRIVNVPCHPGLAALSDEQIHGLFVHWANLPAHR